MPADTTLATKRRNTNTTAPTTSPDHDHRKRRRNRTTQSCLNCHTTKRMCDRKRPCSRCTQLGLTGLCVYEVHDPARQSTASDESSRLLNRITELEGVVRDLKNKPHPRWADSREMPLPHSPPGVPTSSPMSSPHVDPSLLGLSSLGDISWADLLHWDSPRSSDSAYSHSPISTPSPLVMSGFRPPEPSPPVVRHDCHGNAHLARKVNSGCDCLREPACYNMAVELGSQLRRVATVMNRSLGHCFGTPCPLNTKISELEALTRNALQNSDICPGALDISAVPSQVLGMITDGGPSEHHAKLTRRDPFWDENGLPAYDDSFMSWIPPVGVVLKNP